MAPGKRRNKQKKVDHDRLPRGVIVDAAGVKRFKDKSDIEKRFTDKDRDVEAGLEDMLFGASADSIEKSNAKISQDFNSKAPATWADSDDSDAEVFSFDKSLTSSNDATGADPEDSDADIFSGQPQEQGNGNAWEDSDDEEMMDISVSMTAKKLREVAEETLVSGVELQKRLRAKHDEIKGKSSVSWVDEAVERLGDDPEAQGEVVSATGGLDGTGILNSSKLRVARSLDLNDKNLTHGVVQSVRFHPSLPLAIVCGLDKSLRIFHVDGSENEHLRTIHIQGFPIWGAEFIPGTTLVVCVGRRNHFYVVNFESGKVELIKGIMGTEKGAVKTLEGMVASPSGEFIAFAGPRSQIFLVSTTTRQVVKTFKQAQNCTAMCFSPDGSTLFTGGSDGRVYGWNLATKRCIDYFNDSGSMRISKIAVSEETMAVGSHDGVVNLYSRHSIFTHKMRYPEPLKAIMNLTTSCSVLEFSHDGSVLAFASSVKKNDFKMLHVAERVVFKNWPTTQTPVHKVTSVSFSPKDGYLAIGNARGRVLLYRLLHYKNV